MLLWSSPAYCVLTQGVVREGGSQVPLAEAIVRIQTTTPTVITNASGEFAIDVPLDLLFPTLTAAKFGYVNNGYIDVIPGATDVAISLRKISTEPREEVTFLDPLNCGGCHSNHFVEWFGSDEARPSRHSTAGQNRWVRDLYDGSGTPGGSTGYLFVRDSPILSDQINPTGLHRSGLCAECHLPTLASVAPVLGTVKLSDATAGSVPGSQESIAYESGISCDLCHKLKAVNDNLGRTGFFGNGVVETAEVGVQYGSLTDAIIDTTIMAAAYNPLIGESLACAPCHEYNMDHDFDDDFEEAGSPPGQTTYSEWAESPYAAEGVSCQDCHMPSPETGPVVLCAFGGAVRPKEQMHSHRFEGTTREFLDQAVDLEVVASREGAEIVVEASVTNSGAGHDFPTGVSIRNALLVVRAVSESGQELAWDAGTPLVPDWGGVGEDDNDFGDKPGRGYAEISRSHNGSLRALFIDAVEQVSNTRIPAGETDHSTYRFLVGDQEIGDVTVEAKILYRRVWKDLGELKGWIGGLDGQGFPYEGDVEVEKAQVVIEGIDLPTPTPGGPADYDFEPQPNVDGKIDALDLLHLFKDVQDGSPTRDRLFDFSRFWQVD